MRIRITADSTCDLSAELRERYNIALFPMTVIRNGEAFKDGVDIFEKDLYEYFEKTGKLCSTAASNPSEYMEFFDREIEGFDALIHISLSSGLSSCSQNARIAAGESGHKVFVVDSRNLSTGSGHLVLDAAIMAAEGLEPEAIVEKLNATAELLEVSFVINSLTYLYKGGRCSALEMFGANLLNFRPCINVTDGKLGVGKKYRGAYAAVIRKYVAERLAGRDDIDTSRIFVTHTDTPREIVDSVIEAIGEHMKFDEIIETNAGPTIACHCGPCTLGILFKRKA
ncbi:MAG: DegV family protein [Ruminococcaceae bacterium]|nr:DegV family protein [Oscillospiraceae bacterium]